MSDLIDFHTIDLTSPAIERFAEIYVSRSLPAAGRETGKIIAERVRSRAPVGVTGYLSTKGIRPGRVKVTASVGFEEKIGLSKQGFYGRFQNDGWKFHPEGLHFFEAEEPDSEVVGYEVLDKHTRSALAESGLLI